MDTTEAIVRINRLLCCGLYTEKNLPRKQFSHGQKAPECVRYDPVSDKDREALIKAITVLERAGGLRSNSIDIEGRLRDLQGQVDRLNRAVF